MCGYGYCEGFFIWVFVIILQGGVGGVVIRCIRTMVTNINFEFISELMKMIVKMVYKRY